jgi:hypothetical protein
VTAAAARRRRRSRSALPRARLALPPLEGEDALAIVNFLDRAIAAIWRAHGHAMADCLAELHARPRHCSGASLTIVGDDLGGLADQASLPF